MRSYILSNNKYDINGNVIPNKFISPLGNEVTLYFPSPLHLDNNKSYEVSIRRASIVYCTPNISASLGNNKLTYSFRDATNALVSKTFTFDDGLYSLDVINFKLSLFTSQIANGHDSQLIFFFPDESTSRIYVSFSQTNVSVDATATNSILISLGFTTDQGTYGDGIIGNFTDTSLYEISNRKAQLNPIQNYLVSTNISTGNYFDADVSNIVEYIPIGKTSAGSLTEFDCNNVNYADVNATRIDKLVVSLLDNYGNPIDMNTSNGKYPPEAFSVLLCITEKK